LWKNWEAGKVSALRMDLNLGIISDVEKKLKKKLLIDYLYSNLKHHNFWAYRYFFCEFLALLNVSGKRFSYVSGKRFSTFQASVSQCFRRAFLNVSGERFSMFQANVSRMSFLYFLLVRILYVNITVNLSLFCFAHYFAAPWSDSDPKFVIYCNVIGRF
jgi:hypothetical protein